MHHPRGEPGESGSDLISVTRAFIVRRNSEAMTDNRSILVTGAAGRLGAVGRTVAEVLLDRGLPVRAIVRREDDRAAALRAAGAEIVLGDILEPADVYRVVNASPVATADVARVIAAVLADPIPHLGRIYELTGPCSQDMHGVAREYSDALNREVVYLDIPPADWERELKQTGLQEHLIRHLLTMADLNRAGRYDRMPNGVERMTGRPAMSIRESCRFTRMPSAVVDSGFRSRPTLASLPGGPFAPPRDMVHGQAKVERGDGAPLRISMSRLE